MKNFEVTVQENKISHEVECHISLQSNGFEDLYNNYPNKVPEYVYLARVANSVMSRFCALLFPRYEVMIRLGRPIEYRYYNDDGYGTLTKELVVRITGYMDESEKHRLVEMLQRIVAESQREAYNA